MTLHPADSILIVDFGSQVTQLIARRVREAGVYCEIAPFNAADEAFERLQPRGIILSGGPSSVMWDDSPRAPQNFFELIAVAAMNEAFALQTFGFVIVFVCEFLPNFGRHNVVNNHSIYSLIYSLFICYLFVVNFLQR